MGSVNKKAFFKGVKAATPKGEKFGVAAKTLAKYGINKFSTGKIHTSEALKITRELKGEHVLKAHIGDSKMATSGETAKEILQQIAGSKKEDMGPSAAEARAQHLEEKKELLTKHGVKVSTDVIQKSTARVYLVERQKEQEKEEAQALSKEGKKAGGKGAPTAGERRAGSLETLRQTVLPKHEREPEDMFASVPVPDTEPQMTEEPTTNNQEPITNNPLPPPVAAPPAASDAIDPFGS